MATHNSCSDCKMDPNRWQRDNIRHYDWFNLLLAHSMIPKADQYWTSYEIHAHTQLTRNPQIAMTVNTHLSNARASVATISPDDSVFEHLNWTANMALILVKFEDMTGDSVCYRTIKWTELTLLQLTAAVPAQMLH